MKNITVLFTSLMVFNISCLFSMDTTDDSHDNSSRNSQTFDPATNPRIFAHATRRRSSSNETGLALLPNGSIVYSWQHHPLNQIPPNSLSRRNATTPSEWQAIKGSIQAINPDGGKHKATGAEWKDDEEDFNPKRSTNNSFFQVSSNTNELPNSPVTEQNDADEGIYVLESASDEGFIESYSSKN